MKQIRHGEHHLICTKGYFTPWTMKSDHGRWPFPGFNFLKNRFTKPLDTSLGVTQMWIKRTDHAPEVKVLIFSIYAQKRQFRKKIKFDRSFVFISSSPKNISSKKNYIIIALPWPLVFFSY